MHKYEPRNHLLKQLLRSQSRILSTGEFVHIDLNETLFEANKPFEHVYFPEFGVISLTIAMSNGKIAETSTLGNEGFLGIPIMIGENYTAEKAFCQVEAAAWRVPIATFEKLLKDDSNLHFLCQRFILAFLNHVSRNSACNSTHTIEQRCARWLLLTQDRVEGDSFLLTQEFLALMLGVSRSGVNVVAGELAKANLISYVRGKISILDRPGLLACVCECYGVMRAEFDKVVLPNAEGLYSSKR